MEKVEEGGKQLCFGEKVMDTIQYTGKAPFFFEFVGSAIDGAINSSSILPFL